jgi:3-carboxy-cis,cis-muconate cycloisomerase
MAGARAVSETVPGSVPGDPPAGGLPGASPAGGVTRGSPAGGVPGSAPDGGSAPGATPSAAERAGLFDGIFARGEVDAGSGAWLQAMLDAEAALARAVERAGLVPAGAGAAVTAAVAEAVAAGRIDQARLSAQAALTGNPVPALVRELTRTVPPEAAAAVHRGATSQDIIDTAAMLLARHALGVIAADVAQCADAAARLATAHRDTLMIGRTLLQQAVPVTFGLVAAGWLSSLDEAAAGLSRVRAQRLAVQFGGAAGTLASFGPDGPTVARLFAEELGLGVPVLPWHTDRWRIVEVAAACAGVAAALGKIARDVTLLAQTEIGEVREGDPPSEMGARRRAPGAGVGGTGAEGGGEFGDADPRGGAAAGGAGAEGGAGVWREAIASPDGGSVRRGGSSAMPHKRNPVAAIAILGCTRRVPGLLATLAAATEQEHQRAAGAWHAEWEPFSDLLRLTGSASSWAVELLTRLVVDPVRMHANLVAAHGLPLAESLAGMLAPALGPVEAHDVVARASAHAVAADVGLGEALLSLDDVRHRLDEAGISLDQINSALHPANYLGATQHFIEAALASHGAKPPPPGS